MIPIPYEDENPLPGANESLICLIGLNVLALKLSSPQNIAAFGFIPAHPGPLSWVASLFLHAGIWHLLGNMWFLWIFGRNVEAVMGAWFIPFYLCCGVAGDALQMALDPSLSIPCVGASGAVSGVLGAYAVYFPRARVKCYSLMMTGFTRPESIKYSISAIVYFLIYFMAQYIDMNLHPDDGIGYAAHLGGAAFGAVTALAFPRTEAARTLAVSGGSGARPPGGNLSPEVPAIERAMAEGREDAAVREYTDAVRRDPYFALSERPQIQMADLLTGSGYPHLAKSAVEKFLLRYPRSSYVPAAQRLLGSIEQDFFQDFPAAEKYYRRALLHPGLDSDDVGRVRAKLQEVRTVLERTFIENPRQGVTFHVFLEDVATPGAAKIKKIARVLGVPPQEASELLAREPGCLLKGFPTDKAANLARQLEDAGIPVVVFPEDRLVPLPKLESCTQMRSDPDYVAFSSAPDMEASTRIAWKDCLLIAAAALRVPVSVERELGILEVKVLDIEGKTYLSEEALQPLIEVVSLNPPGRYRWRPSKEPKPESVMLETYFASLQELVFNSLNVPLNAGAEKAFDRHLPASCIFNDEAALAGYMYWQMQLAHLKKAGFYRS